MKADFSGYVTKAGLKCSDGRTIMPDAFKHMDKMKVPLVWQHDHNSPDNVLGHVLLEARSDGLYGYGFCNDTTQGKNAKALVQHEDIKSLSIYANGLIERAKQVFHGMVREVSLVLSGANPGAFIDYVEIAHGNGDFDTSADTAIIYTGLELEHSDASDGDDQGEEDDDLAHATVQEVYDSFSPEQQDVVHFLIGAALDASKSDDATHSDEGDKSDDKTEGDLTHQEGKDEMSRNVFEKDAKGGTTDPAPYTLTHEDVKGIMMSAVKGGSLKEAAHDFAIAHGIDNMEVLFPEVKTIGDTPEFQSRRMEWVAGVLNGTRHSPFSRVKTISADITMDEARAKGYIKGTMKKEEFFSVTKRTTGPTTVYKKQKLDRDDILDITDFDVVSWMKGEMRIMLEEEIARAILIGDGRSVDDDDKIKDPAGATEGTGIRSVLNDHEMYVTTINVNLNDASSSYLEFVEEVTRGMRFYKGTGQPTMYTTLPVLTELLLVKDTQNRRLFANKAELASTMMVRDIVAVEVMEGLTDNTLAILVNLADYNIGADKGGEVNLFDFFDIDFNQYKYLIETRISGALVKLKSALVIKNVASTKALVSPITAPTFVSSTGVVTIPTQTGVTYKNFDTSATLSSGAQTALDPGESLHVLAVADSTHYFETNAEDEWTFTRPSA